MKPYTENEPVFSEFIQVTEPTDPAHADNINAAPKQLLQNTLVNRKAVQEMEQGNQTVEFEDYSGEGAEVPDPEEAVNQVASGKADKVFRQYVKASLKGMLNLVQRALSIAMGKNQARVFATVEALDAWLAVPANVQQLNVGDNFYITATDVPDYWWDGKQKQKLETQKVDLTTYDQRISELYGNFDRIIDRFYPIGTVYTSTKNVSPASFIGGTWTPIKDTFLLCAGDKYKAGSTGGSSTKTVPLAVHNHRFTPAGSVSSNANSVDGGHTHTIPNHSHDVSLYSSIEQDSISVKLRTNSPNDTDGSWNTSVVHFGKGSATYVNSNAIDLSVSAHRHTIQGSTSNVISSNNTSRNGSQISTTVSSSFKGTAGTTENAGSGETLDIMPPYKTVYAWERTA